MVGEPTCPSSNYLDVETIPANSMSNVGNKTMDAYSGSHGEIDPTPIDESLSD